MRVWCAFSGHGYGHLVQVAPVLNGLAEVVPHLALHLAGVVPDGVAQRWLHCRFTLDPTPQDVCLAQRGPMVVDLPATRAALRAFHAGWDAAVQDYAAALADWRPDVLLADIPYLPLAAAARAGVPSVALSSFSWDRVLEAYTSLAEPEVHGWWEAMRAAYAHAELALQVTPGLMGGAFRDLRVIEPVVEPTAPACAALRALLALPAEVRLVLVTMGGIAEPALPLEALRAERRVVWLISGTERPAPNVIGLDGLAGWNFPRVAASVDAVVGKLGYNTTVQAAASGVPMLYVRRLRFPDEAPLAAWVQAHHRARELSPEQFRSGDWYAELQALLALPRPPRPPLGGAAQAVRLLLQRYG